LTGKPPSQKMEGPTSDVPAFHYPNEPQGLNDFYVTERVLMYLWSPGDFVVAQGKRLHEADDVVEELAAAVDLVRSYSWRVGEMKQPHYILCLESECARITATGEAGRSKGYFTPKSLESFIVEARDLTLEDKAIETLVNLKHVYETTRKPIQLQYAGVQGYARVQAHIESYSEVPLPVIFEANDGMYEDGMAYGCDPYEAAEVYTHLQNLGYIEAPRGVRPNSTVIVTPRGRIEVDKHKKAMRSTKAENNVSKAEQPTAAQPTGVFIGHGRSPLYAFVESYIRNEFGVEVHTFERHSTPGGQVIPTLEKMLEESGFAVIVATAEDEAEDGSRARQNVVHETGLFQGKLGFSRVVLIQQDGIKSYSNIDGLIYARFSGNDINRSFLELDKAMRTAGYKHVERR
jgi:predicted nucleotide-binding protein